MAGAKALRQEQVDVFGSQQGGWGQDGWSRDGEMRRRKDFGAFHHGATSKFRECVNLDEKLTCLLR